MMKPQVYLISCGWLKHPAGWWDDETRDIYTTDKALAMQCERDKLKHFKTTEEKFIDASTN